MCMRGARFDIEVFREPEDQNVAQKIENGFFNRGIPPFGRSDGAFDDLSVFFAYRLTRREISSINGKTGDRFSHGTRERFEGEIAIPAVRSEERRVGKEGTWRRD